MKKNTTLPMQQSLTRIALGTALLLLIPVIGRFPWTAIDYMVMAILIFIAGLGVDIFVRQKRTGNYKAAFMGIAIVLGMLWLWAELAVGLFTNWGS